MTQADRRSDAQARAPRGPASRSKVYFSSLTVGSFPFFVKGSIEMVFQSLALLSLPSVPTVPIAVIVVALVGLAIPVGLALLAQRTDVLTIRQAAGIVAGLVIVTVAYLVIQGGLPSITLPAFSLDGLPTIPIPDIGLTELLAMIIATTIPIAAYQIIQLTRVVKWFDVVVFIGLTLLPAAAVLGLMHRMSGAAFTGITGIMTAHALGIIDTD